MSADEHGSGATSALEAQLLEARERMLAFVRSRVANPELAEDILQDGLLRAVRSFDELRDEERLVPWLYAILRRGIVDAYRRRDVRQRHTTSLPDGLELADEPSEADEHALCECFRGLVPALRPEYGELIESELAEEPAEQLASRLGITANNLKVRRHRARRALRERLEESCRLCASHGCLDCTCEVGAQRAAVARATST